jgi:phosphocarrier protein
VSKRVVVQAEIKNKLGLHARPAMAFVDAATQFASSITVARVEPSGSASSGGVDGKSIMQMMMLAATKGTILEIVAEGADASHAAESLKILVESGFDED